MREYVVAIGIVAVIGGLWGCAVQRKIKIPAGDDQAVQTLVSSLDADCQDGIIHLDNGDYDKATESLQRVVSRDPKDWRAQLALGVAYEARGMLKDALQCYKAANLGARQEVEDIMMARKRVEARLGQGK